MDSSASSGDRLGGIALLIGCLGYACAVIVYLGVYGRPEGTGVDGTLTLADRVGHYLSHSSLAHGIWIVEMVSVILLSIAAITLMRRFPTDSGAARFSWAAVLTGAVFLFPMYPLMLGGYPEASRLFDVNPGLSAMLDGVVLYIFYVGNSVLFIGLGGALCAESAISRLFPRPVGYTALGLGIAGSLGAVGSQAQVAALQPLVLGGILVIVLGIYAGLRLSVLK